MIVQLIFFLSPKAVGAQWSFIPQCGCKEIGISHVLNTHKATNTNFPVTHQFFLLCFKQDSL